MKNVLVVFAVVLALGSNVWAQGFLDAPEEEGGPAPILVTPEQLVDAFKVMMADEGLVRRWEDRKAGVLIVELPIFPLTWAYKFPGVPPKDLFPVPSPLQKRAKLQANIWNMIATGERKETAKSPALKKQLRDTVRSELTEMVELISAPNKKGGKGHANFTIDLSPLAGLGTTASAMQDILDSSSADISQGVLWEMWEASKIPTVTIDDIQWFTCLEVNTPKANERTPNPQYDPEASPACLIKVVFDGTERRKAIVSITLASVSDLPGDYAFLVTEYGMTKENAHRIPQMAHLLVNSPVLQEGLLDRFMVKEGGKKFNQEDEVQAKILSLSRVLKALWLANLLWWAFFFLPAFLKNRALKKRRSIILNWKDQVIRWVVVVVMGVGTYLVLLLVPLAMLLAAIHLVATMGKRRARAAA